MLQKAQAKLMEKKQKDDKVKSFIKKLIDDGMFLGSCKRIVEEYKQATGQILKEHYVRAQLHELNLGYGKAKFVPKNANSEQSLVLRQIWATKYLDINHRYVTVINLDESWLGQADFRRSHWRPKSGYQSINEKKIPWRISMIVGVSSHGDLYLTLTQSNSNKSMMGIFLERLVQKLDKKNQHWRNCTVITWDGRLSFGKFRFVAQQICCESLIIICLLIGAPYHKAEGVKTLLKRLQIPIMMHGPYSYDVAPAELFFAAFK